MLPVADYNQGNIHTAMAQIVSAVRNLESIQYDLQSQLSEAYGRYELNRHLASSLHDDILPVLTQAYQGIIRRYQVEPEKVSFNDIIVAQQNLSQSIQSYLAAVAGQWQAVTDLASVAQVDDLFSGNDQAVDEPAK